MKIKIVLYRKMSFYLSALAGYAMMAAKFFDGLYVKNINKYCGINL